MRKRKWLSLLICATMVIMMLPATAWAAANVPYLDENGAPQTCTSATVVTDSDTTWSGGWYVVSSNVTISSRIKVSGNVHLILADGYSLNAADGIRVPFGNSLTIYGQASGMGKLIAETNTVSTGGAGIGSDYTENAGTITINGGTIEAKGCNGGAGIGGAHSKVCSTITINGGNITATGGACSGAGSGAGIGCGFNAKGGSVIINGGIVIANGNGAGGWKAPGIGGGSLYAGQQDDTTSVTIAGGTVTANGYSGYAGISGEFKATGNAVIYASSINDTSSGNTRSGIIFEGDNGTVYGDQTLNTDLTIAEGKTLTVPADTTLTNAAGSTLTNNGTLTNSGTISNLGTINGAVINNGTLSSSGTINGAVTGNQPIIGAKYLDEKGEEQTAVCDGVITSENIGSYGTLNSGWYVVKDNVTADSRITVSGTVHLILADGYTLTASKGIGVSPGNSLTIYGQSAGTGTLTATGKEGTNYGSAGIGGTGSANGGTITINGGTINATGGTSGYYGGAGIGGGGGYSGGDITINGGTVHATGGTTIYSGAGIGGGGMGSADNITINGGTVTAIGGVAFSVRPTVNTGLKTSAGASESALTSVVIADLTDATYTGNKAVKTEICTTHESDTVVYKDADHHALICKWCSAESLEAHSFVGNGDCVCGAAKVNYLDEHGTEQTAVCQGAIKADNIGSYGTLSDGWYVVRGIVEVSQRITVNGDAHLILADQSSLNVKGGIGVPQGSHFQIFGQAGQTGSLIATEDLAGRNCGIGGTGQYSYAGDITVNGGQITAGAGLYSAAIGGAADGYGGNVTINGGTVTATGNDSPAIGGGYNGDCGDITINGGTISATGGRRGAGIGGGNNKAGGTITINGGEIEATGGYDAAGIGGGRLGSGGTIKINGGSVTAKSGGWGAGIGGGYGGSAGYIVINDGTVNASCTGTYGYGAGIGSGGYNEGSKTNDGTIIVNGGHITATNQETAAGIGGGCNYTSGTVIITGGIVTANGSRAGIGGGQDSSDGSFTTNITNEGGTTTDGNAIIFASSISDQSGKADGTWSGVIFEGDAGQVYGTTITPIENFTIESGKSLLIPTGSTLNTSGINAVNSGNVYVGGTLSGALSGSGSYYYPLTVTGGTAGGDASTYLDTLYGKATGTVTLTPTAVPVGQAVSGWTASDSGVTVENNAFTMPSKALTVTAQYVNAPTYTVTIPASVTLDSTATISAEGVNVVDRSSLVVKLTDAQGFKLTTDEGAELSYSITKDSTALSAGSTVLSVAGGIANNTGSAVLTFSAPTTAVKYSGDYKGTITFTVSIADGGGT